MTYQENIDDGGSANVRLNGDSFYASPGLKMRREDLVTLMDNERASKAENYHKSRGGELESQLDD